jgi:hypothetical protein
MKSSLLVRERPFVRKQVPLDRIECTRATQARLRMLPDLVARYVEVLESGGKFDADPEVYFDGSVYWPGDGFHRLAAYAKVGRDKVWAIVREGTHRDAMIHAAGANERHGQRRTRKEVRRAIALLLDDEEIARLSDRTIAKLADTTNKTVADVKRELGLDGSTRVYTDRHGNETEMNVSGLKGRTLAGSVPCNDFHEFPEPLRDASRQLFTVLQGQSRTVLASFLRWLGSELLPLQTPKKFRDFVTLLDAEAEAPPEDADDAADAPTF